MWSRRQGGMHPFPLPQVIESHLPEIRALVRALCPELARDAPDETFVAVAYPGLHEAHQRFDPAASVGFWSYAVHRVRGSILDEREALARAEQKGRLVRETAETWRDPEPVTPETMFEHEELCHVVRQEIELLPTRERNVVRGFYLEERCLDDLGAQIGKSRSWVSRIHTRGIGLLRERLTR